MSCANSSADRASGASPTTSQPPSASRKPRRTIPRTTVSSRTSTVVACCPGVVISRWSSKGRLRGNSLAGRLSSLWRGRTISHPAATRRAVSGDPAVAACATTVTADRRARARRTKWGSRVRPAAAARRSRSGNHPGECTEVPVKVSWPGMPAYEGRLSLSPGGHQRAARNSPVEVASPQTASSSDQWAPVTSVPRRRCPTSDCCSTNRSRCPRISAATLRAGSTRAARRRATSQVRLHVAGGAGIGVLAPGAADGRGLLERDEGAGALQLQRAAMPRPAKRAPMTATSYVLMPTRSCARLGTRARPAAPPRRAPDRARDSTPAR